MILKDKHIILVSTPWPLFSRPSIQLGALKAYLKSQFPALKAEAHHFYLKAAEHIGYKSYQAISERTWLAESVYAALLFPDRFEQIEAVFKKESRANDLSKDIGFRDITEQIRDITETFIRSRDWGSFDLAGFSVCLCQLTSGLYVIRRVKEQYPKLPVVIGGSLLSGDSAGDILQVFPEVDFAVNGEGELPLSHIVRYIGTDQENEALAQMPGIVTRKSSNPGFRQMETLEALPVPDYDEYFDLLKSLGPKKAFFPILPVEMSRGCWWRKKEAGKNFSGCAFCNLNLQWEGFRSKSPEQAVSEINCLTEKHKLLSVAVMDNVSPLKTSGEIFSRLSQLNKDLDMFCEIRPTTPKSVLERMKNAGVNEVQIGIEALSTSLLNKLNKGTTAIQNLEIMRDCEALGISNHSNLILHFPGSDSQDMDETLHTLDFALPFRPLRFVHFWLGLESPVWHHPREFGIKAVFNHPYYAALFPESVFKSVSFMIQAYRGDMRHQKKLWEPVKKKIRIWKKTYAELYKNFLNTPILSFQDGGDFLIIRQRQIHDEALTHRLLGTSREIYLFCQQHRHIRDILSRFPNLSQEKILPFLNMMRDKKLMFEEEGKYLSLAVPGGSAA